MMKATVLNESKYNDKNLLIDNFLSENIWHINILKPFLQDNFKFRMHKWDDR